MNLSEALPNSRHSMNASPTSYEAYMLLHRGAEALSDVQMNGIKVDVPYCKKEYRRLSKKLASLEKDLFSYEEVRRWKHKYGKGFTFNSNKQLGDILYNDIGYEPLKFTDTNEPSTDQEALEATGAPFIPTLIEYNQSTRVRNTYLKGIIKESVDGYVHPFFNLNLVQTYRSSSDAINFQNLPIRNPNMGPIVRRAIIAEKDYYIVEVDYSGIEVMSSSWYHQDPNMLSYIADPKSDMHKDTAIQIYMLDSLNKESCEKDIRKVSKNSFVFPEFYGDYWRSCATQLWNDIHKYGLKLKDGTPLRKHLKRKGIKNKAQFEQHVRNIEYDFWNNRFPTYKRWREFRIEDYNAKGYGDSLFGFRFQGVLAKNKIFNYPIQSAAFHCLLWSLIEMNTELKKNNWKSKIIGQIHDSIVAVVHKKELDDYLNTVQWIMCDKILDEYPFIITHLEIEADVAPPGSTWNDKKAYPLQ